MLTRVRRIAIATEVEREYDQQLNSETPNSLDIPSAWEN